ncbi:Elongation factor 4 [Sedimentisphaera cyanobacteriorum]|uniref:Elongation factor 4 n=1 Tax=Sedimentisphaera cyanobacteriorum TaxID=1940790 RepID=A0A1Q2HNJ5_9BACT|nr:translation elongation factor 4 [Sedimentisphaera cyanobacteriorum]AQQ08806.1 Elongation factor 4 [Sedimentisphaera cyanobacteriorum]
MNLANIRNFSIVAHIDHGKSTIADRIMLHAGAVTEREFHNQLLDSMDLERERGITIKASAVTMYVNYKGEKYMLNLIDTPGHVDFSYEVSRALTACEGALLVVDSAQGVEAQTVANAYLAINEDLEIIPVLNKIDLPAAMPETVIEELGNILGIGQEECIYVSAKSGKGVDDLIGAIIERLPAPEDHINDKLQAMVFDSHFDEYRGVICYLRVVSGSIKEGQKISFMSCGHSYTVTELGKFTPKMDKRKELGCGEVGYMIANIKSLSDVRVGDTITSLDEPAEEPLPGYEPPMQMVFSDFYPAQSSDYPKMKAAFERLALNDSSFTFFPQNSPALGFGFRCGFLGLLHMEIVQERLERENDIEVIQTSPSVSYEVLSTSGEIFKVDSPSQLPEKSEIEEFREPFVKLEIIMPKDYIGTVMQLAEQRRCVVGKTEYLGSNRVMMQFKAPLAEIVYDFYDILKGATRGYATMDYELLGFEKSDLVKIDILVNKVEVDALSTIVHRDSAETRGRKMITRLRQAIPRQQFEVPLQVAVGGKVIARETIKAYRKDVTSKLYGGDITRKMKVLKKQKEGKKRMKSVASVQIPQEAFKSVLKSGE